MEFNFYDRYKDYTTTQLLHMLKTPQDYQPAALEAVTKILQERQVSDEEQLQVDEQVRAVQVKERRKAVKLEFYKRKIAGFLQSVLQPQSEFNPHKWIRILLVVIVIQYIWSLGVNLYFFIRSAGSGHFYLSVHLPAMITIVYVPIIFYLLYKRKRWGWILLFADSLIVLISTLSRAGYLFGDIMYLKVDASPLLLALVVKGAIAYFLWKPVTAAYFGVTLQTKKSTVLLSIAIAVLFTGFMYLLF